ncbi:hypothetical protein GCM10023197_17940 [Gordonia humi]
MPNGDRMPTADRMSATIARTFTVSDEAAPRVDVATVGSFGEGSGAAAAAGAGVGEAVVGGVRAPASGPGSGTAE